MSSVTGCFHLETGVHLEEVELLGSAGHHEFDGTRGFVVNGTGQGHGLLAHRLAHLGVDEGGRRFFDDLLVTTLDRAVTFVKVDVVALGVAQHLDFDVARLEHVLLDEDAVVAEGVAGFIDAGGEAFVGFGVVVRPRADPCRRRRRRP